MNVWDQLKERADELSDSMFLKLEQGEKLITVFLGDPVPREVVWTGETYLDAASEDGQALLKRGKRATFRAAVNVCVLPEYALKVFEMAGSTFKDLYKLREKYGLDAWCFEIERQTKNKYQMLPERQLTDEETQQIGGLALIDLAGFGGTGEQAFDTYDRATAGADSTGSSAEPSQAASNPAVREASVDDIASLTTRLRNLPKAAVQRFLDHFGVQRVRDLPTDARGKATALLDQLERTEIDPFE